MEWARGKDGVYSAASGCRLRPRDLARIGQVVLAKGEWNGRQVVPAAWPEESFKARAIVDDGRHYGYLVVTAGNYDTEDQWRPPIVLLRDVFLANLIA